MAAHIEEFLYRGPTATNGYQGAWHVIVIEDVTAFGETKQVLKGPMTPSQAAQAGFPLDTILGQIAADAIKRAETAEAHLAIAVEAIQAANAQLDETQKAALPTSFDLELAAAGAKLAAEPTPKKIFGVF